MVREVKSRELVLPMMTMHAIQSLKLIDKIDDSKLGNFLAKVQGTYHSVIPYHNDLHGADVMQMTFFFMT